MTSPMPPLAPMPPTPPVTRARCAALDAQDPLWTLREQFHLPEGVIYLDGNSLGALPKATVSQVNGTLVTAWGERLIRSWNEAGWIDLPRRIGAKIARLVGAAEDEVIATDSTSVNLFKVLAAALRMAGELPVERRVIVSEAGNFPTDLYVAQGLLDLLGAAQGGWRLELVASDEALDAALAGAPGIVMLTQVDYRSGRLLDLADITARAHRAGALIIWDLAHSAGAVPVDLNGAGADFAVGCGYKYLNGGPGAPAFVFVARRHQEQFWQPLSGWLGHAAPFDFDARYRPAQGIARYLCGTPPVLSMVALDAGLDTVLAAEPLGGMAALRAKSSALTDVFVAAVEERCAADALRLASPRAAERRGSQVSFHAGAELGGGYALMQALIAAGVVGDFRAPDILRFGMSPLYTRYVDVWDAAATLGDILAERSWDRPEFHARAAVT